MIAIGWQWSADAALSVYDASPTLHAQSFYLPLVEELNRRKAADGPFRTEVVPLREHWETRWIPPGLPIARGWERQLDVALNPQLYDDRRLDAGGLPALAARAGDHLRRGRPRAVRQGRAQGGRAPAPGAGRRTAARLAVQALEALRRPGRAAAREPARAGHRARPAQRDAHDAEADDDGGPRALHAVLEARPGTRLRRARTGGLDTRAARRTGNRRAVDPLLAATDSRNERPLLGLRVPAGDLPPR